MLSLRLLLTCALAGAAACSLPAEDKKPAAPADDGFKPMFNGKNLDGWVNVNCHPDTFFVKGDEVITTGKPMGFLRTEKQYENFVLEMDWMHVNTKEVGNSGLFVWGDPLPTTGSVYTRGIEVQVLVNLEYRDKKSNAVTASSHGDLFSIMGASCVPDRPHPLGWARCLPSENRAKGGGEWNHYKVTANDGVIKLEVNGKEVSGVSKCNPRKGYLALESEGAECHFKNLKIKELPSTNPKPEECAKVWEGHTSIFNGIDLKGWKTTNDGWMVKGGVLKAMGGDSLSTEKKYDNAELVVDWRLTDKEQSKVLTHLGSFTMMLDPATGTSIGGQGPGFPIVDGKKIELKPGAWNRTIMRVEGKTYSMTVNGTELGKWEAKDPLPADSIYISSGKGLEVMNVFVRELKEKK